MWNNLTSGVQQLTSRLQDADGSSLVGSLADRLQHLDERLVRAVSMKFMICPLGLNFCGLG